MFDVIFCYFDNEIDDTLTQVYGNQTFGDEITEYIDKVKEGYAFAKVENLPLTIGVNEDENVISVYYITATKEDPIPTPNTGDDATRKYYELFMIFVGLLVAYYTNKKIKCEQ